MDEDGSSVYRRTHGAGRSLGLSVGSHLAPSLHLSNGPDAIP